MLGRASRPAPSFVVLAVSTYIGEVEQAVGTTAGQGWCPGCGSAGAV
jgi:hypothetical protein